MRGPCCRPSPPLSPANGIAFPSLKFIPAIPEVFRRQKRSSPSNTDSSSSGVHTDEDKPLRAVAMARPYAPESRIRRACASPRSKQAAYACTAEDVVSIPEIQRLESDRVSLRDIIQYTQPEPEHKHALVTDGHDKDNHMHIATHLPGARQAKIKPNHRGPVQSEPKCLHSASL